MLSMFLDILLLGFTNILTKSHIVYDIKMHIFFYIIIINIIYRYIYLIYYNYIYLNFEFQDLKILFFLLKIFIRFGLNNISKIIFFLKLWIQAQHTHGNSSLKALFTRKLTTKSIFSLKSIYAVKYHKTNCYFTYFWQYCK